MGAPFCNTTLEEMRIHPGDERPIAGPLIFHSLALIIAAASTVVAIVMSLYLIMRHATNYTVPNEQKQIIRILFMVPIYACSSFLSLRFYWHAIYFQVLSDCYEAFAISSFFSLMCHYIAPDLHLQKEYFREMQPIKDWVWPVNWMAKCCGGHRKGPWRTPRSGLTWFNIVWIGVYHYCFVRVAMTVAAVLSQYHGRYCESSNSPMFGHIWIVAIQSTAVTIAMYALIQFYVQLKETLAPHSPFLKILAIKLVIFLSFWQSVAISVGTSESIHVIRPNSVLAYPDIKVGIPSLLLCIEMACFAILHLWAFPYAPYKPRNRILSTYDGASMMDTKKHGGFLGILALWDAINIWDVIKGFGRGIRWLFVGVQKRERDVSYLHLDKNNQHHHPLGPIRGRQKSSDSSSIEVVEHQQEMGVVMHPGDLEAPAQAHQHQYAHGVYGHDGHGHIDTSYRGAGYAPGRSESFDSSDLAGSGMPRAEYDPRRGRNDSVATIDEQYHRYGGGATTQPRGAPLYRNQTGGSGYYDPLPAPRPGEEEDSVGLVSHATHPYGNQNGHR
ncbi:organic solute transporter Ostalpha-domain-containing protein [Sordaria brevicollis]|uniref:Organic solute transporter Ostalpha-domain-containing protein n=1 Tax=Sordaria brevicollis TaxID=83679 RepID=A0AAE0PEE0_SORBR|nr:organic solute transporter Ostalpha-domain-containing protein [Sordaria brevicollis]